MKIIDSSIRAGLHQASATKLQQLCDDARDIVINENNGVPGNWVAAPFWSDSIVFMQMVSLASLKKCGSIDSDNWCKRALKKFGYNAHILDEEFLLHVFTRRL